jgi:hypothetical protein
MDSRFRKRIQTVRSREIMEISELACSGHANIERMTRCGGENISDLDVIEALSSGHQDGSEIHGMFVRLVFQGIDHDGRILRIAVGVSRSVLQIWSIKLTEEFKEE